jgi:methyl-accepting chemotaxis protein
VAEAGATMAEIVDSVRRVTDIMGEISSASLEQTEGIEQINGAVAQMDEGTQQNAALVEEAAAAAAALREQSTRLAQAVSVFRIDGEQMLAASTASVGASPAAAPSPSARPALAASKPATRPVSARGKTKADAREWEEF